MFFLALKEQIRNGVSTGRIGYTAPTKVTETEQNAINRKNNNLDTSKGLQESWDSYDNCYMRERNKGNATSQYLGSLIRSVSIGAYKVGI